MSYWIFQCGNDCTVWQQLTLCAGEEHPGYDVYVHEDDAPASAGTYRVLGHCYDYDPSAPKACLPKGAVITTLEGTEFVDCSDCATNGNEDDDSGGGGSGGPGGPPGGGGGGGSNPDHEPDEPPEPCWIEALLCDDYSGGPRVFVHCDGVSEKTWFRYLGRCYSIDPDDPSTSDPPADAHRITVSGSYENCSDCSDGVQAKLCPDNNPPDTSEAPDVWCPVRDLSGSAVHFNLGDFCYELDPTDTPGTIPVDATILIPPDQYSDCTACLTGVQAQLCPDPNRESGQQPNADQAPDVWVETDTLPGATRYWRVRGWCYSIDPTGTPERIPAGALVLTPPDQFIDCVTCLCGAPDEAGNCGIKLQPCAGQADKPIEELWVRCEDAPAQNIVFERNGVCYHFDPEAPEQQLPKGAITIDIVRHHQSCADCVSRNDDDPSGGGPPDPDTPCPEPICPPIDWYRQLAECPGTVGSGKWIREAHICARFNVVPCDLRGLVFLLSDGKCYVVMNTGGRRSVPAGDVQVNREVLAGPMPTSGPSGGCGYVLTDCAGLAGDVYTFDNMSAFLGRVVRLKGEPDTCRLVAETDTACAQVWQFIELDPSVPADGWADCEACPVAGEVDRTLIVDIDLLSTVGADQRPVIDIDLASTVSADQQPVVDVELASTTSADQRADVGIDLSSTVSRDDTPGVAIDLMSTLSADQLALLDVALTSTTSSDQQAVLDIELTGTASEDTITKIGMDFSDKSISHNTTSEIV